MRNGIDIHNYDRQLVNMRVLVSNSKTSDRNKQTIGRFCNFCVADGIGNSRVVKYMRLFRQLAEWFGKDFEDVTKDDVERVVTSIHQNPRFSEYTKKDYNIALKKFYKWLKGNNEVFPPEVKWLKTAPRRNEIKLPSQDGLITENDVKQVLAQTDHPRNKALLSLLYESGCRIGEIATLRRKNVTLDEKGAVLMVNGKTGSRRIRIVWSVPYLSIWLDAHPLRDDDDAPLWTNFGAVNHRKHMRYNTIRTMLLKAFKKAGIKKKFNPHLFRHSRATFLASHMTEAQMKVYFGWVQGSKVAGTYVHLSGKDTDDTILRINGMATDEKKKQEEQLRPKICPRCAELNSFERNYCSRCTAILDLKTAIKEQDRMTSEAQAKAVGNDVMLALLQDEDVRKLLLAKIHEHGLAAKVKTLQT